MNLNAPRFARNARLEECLNNVRTMREPEEGEPVKLIQQALIDLDFPLPESGDDGRFGPETGVQVSQFKLRHEIEPHDPVVGPKTMSKLDELCLDKPPAPFSDREEWRSWKDRPLAALNFTRQDMLALIQSGGSLQLRDTTWLPQPFEEAIMFSITSLLDSGGSPDGPGTLSASWGVGPMDFYHGHICLPGTLNVFPDAQQAQGNGSHVRLAMDKCRRLADAVSAPNNQAWTLAYLAALETEVTTLGNKILDEANGILQTLLNVAAAHSTTAFIVWHSYEEPRWQPNGMQKDNPRRHWIVPVPRGSTSLIHPFFGFSELAVGVAMMVTLQIGFVVEKSGHVTVRPGSFESAMLRGVTEDDIKAAANMP